MTSTTFSRQTTPESLTEQQIASYRRDGFVHLPGVLSRAEAERYAGAALDAEARLRELGTSTGDIFTQLLQLWQHDETLRQLTLDPDLAGIATRLAGVPLRLWHDQLLIKAPHNGAATEYHQDEPYWPHQGSRHALSAWVALVDVPAERGCMTFIPGSQHLTGLRAQDLGDHDDLHSLAPELAYRPRVTVPLRAGDCTFHHSLLAHSANANATDDPRIAHVTIYMDADTRYAPEKAAHHPVTDLLGLISGTGCRTSTFHRSPQAREWQRGRAVRRGAGRAVTAATFRSCPPAPVPLLPHGPAFWPSSGQDGVLRTIESGPAVIKHSPTARTSPDRTPSRGRLCGGPVSEVRMRGGCRVVIPAKCGRR
ncbi:phytanoyl-CoA dioxygenase [Streptomyces sp. WAC 06738]|uniref:phytanoyl-CoA dioxygenase family protein n=1 Tax=Streptomyces sp. WAC 06738 TaxID=2203210 RepID=UPI000F70C11F|nr:phytanoyl-CoA dioxygenase family protein [Streptomyces sp. WAC 06738]AZM49596.1 phytanoyl-CoA dioxygenase [Streptomyces sp. WAC 06738]